MSGPALTTATLKYASEPPNGVRAFFKINADPITGEREKSYTVEDYKVTIENIRGKEESASLDSSGFQYHTHPAKHTAFVNDDEIEREYYPESVDVIKKLTGAGKVHIFDHTIRRRRPGVADDSPEKRQPAAQVHVDQTTASATARVHRHLPEEADALVQKRFQIINLWRPISHAAHDWPLALCDYRSVDFANDGFPVALVYPDREGETLGIKYNENHKWKYLYGMTPEELVLIKCFDSRQDGTVAVFTPHTAFEDPQTPSGAPYRESIELRALVFYD